MTRETKNIARRGQDNAHIRSAEAQHISEQEAQPISEREIKNIPEQEAQHISERKLKNSGIKWIGEIPEEWEVVKIKYVTSTRSENGKFSPESDMYIGLENIETRSNILINTEAEYGTAQYNICKKGDILFSKLRPYLAKAIISPIDGFCTGELLNFKSFNGDKRFLWYYLLSDQFIDIVNASTYGTKMPRASADFIINLPISLPPLSEQRVIADFLDAKCSEIDGLLADLDAEVKTLTQYKKSLIAETVTHGLNPNATMKSLNLGWIDEVPANWSISRIASLYTVRKEKVSDQDYMPLSVTMKGIVPQLENAAKTNHGDDRKLIRKGDFVINSRSDRRGSCGISPYDGSCSLINIVLAPREAMNPQYYDWLFHTSIFADEFYKWGYGIVDDLWTTNWGAMRRIQIPVPPICEQAEIADFLNEKIPQLDQVIADKTTQIETLRSYKSSLIYEYVTGKKQIAGI